MKHVIGIDLGTQSLKGLLVTPEGKIIAESAHSHDPSYPLPGYAEQKVDDWIVSFKQVVKDLLDQSGIDPEEIGTIGFDTQVDGAVAIDQDGEVLRNAFIWLDRRAEKECAQIAEKISADRIFELTGLNLDSSHVAPKILWLRNNEPENFNRAKHILLPGSYMVHWMTGKAYVDYSNASSTMVYNVTKKAWDSELFEIMNLDPELLGEIGAAEDVVGTLTPKAAKELGLSESTKVIIGCGDEHSACLGAGLVKPGMVCDITGTAEPVAAVADRPFFDTIGRLVETHAHADQRWWLIENPGFVSGGSVRWFVDTLGKCSLKELNEMAARIPVGSDGVTFLPCLQGAMTPTWNGNARGTFTGLTMSHNLDAMGRAVLEGCAFGLRDNIDRFIELGMDCSTIRVVGGGSKSDLWNQMKADLLGTGLTCTKNPEGAAIGAAMLASVAEGNFKNLDEAAEVMVELEKSYEPNPANKQAYDDAYARYQDLYFTLEPFFDRKYV